MFGTFESAERDYLNPPEDDCPYVICENCGCGIYEDEPVELMDDGRILCVDCYRTCSEEDDEDVEEC